jgi:hypothetical protein
VSRFEPSATRSQCSSSMGSGLPNCVAATRRPLHVTYDPAFLDDHYASVKQELQSRFPSLTGLPASQRLLTAIDDKRHEMARAFHCEEEQVVALDQFDLVRPVLRAVETIMACIEQPVALQARGVASGNMIDLAIEKWTEEPNPFARLLVFEYKNVPVSRSLDILQACVELGKMNCRLNYSPGNHSAKAAKANLTLAKVTSVPASSWSLRS